MQQNQQLTKSEYEEACKVVDELKDIEHFDERCNQYNEAFDIVIAYENENNIFVAR